VSADALKGRVGWGDIQALIVVQFQSMLTSQRSAPPSDPPMLWFMMGNGVGISGSEELNVRRRRRVDDI
jgi:hypothetical protein